MKRLRGILEGVLGIPILLAVLTLLELTAFNLYKSLRKTGCTLDV